MPSKLQSVMQGMAMMGRKVAGHWSFENIMG
jgi:hypothetical protein